MIKNRAPRNQTITMTLSQEKEYARKAIKKSSEYKISECYDNVIWQDTFKVLKKIPDNIVDLMIVDPPYNLTKNFGDNTFKQMDLLSYQSWLDDWLSETKRILKSDASIYICSDWRTSLAIPQVACKYFFLRNRISWEREKGRSSSHNWKNCLEDIWFFTKSKDYKFNLDAVKIQRKVLAPYKDKKGNPKDWKNVDTGEKIRYTSPSNIWTDITIPFWSMPENTDHPTQKPEKLIAKMILASSNEGDLVFDPFLGSGTTAVVAKKLNRRYLGIEKEQKYVALSLKRLEMADKDKSIQGYENGIFKERNS